MQLPIYHVDAFSDRLFRGNPAAVVILREELPEALMQGIAAENNLSETAFLLTSVSPFALRWFTPAVEVPLCGHATLASAFVLKHINLTHEAEQTFATKSGILRVREQNDVYTLDFPAIPCRRDDGMRETLSRLVGTSVDEVHVSRDRYLCLLESTDAVTNAKPDFPGLAALPLPGVIITAKGDAPYDFTSRYFAPAKGVPEDPVTGAAHCVLTPFWSERLGKPTLRAFQASRRSGSIDCTLDGERVLLSGKARLYMKGAITLDRA